MTMDKIKIITVALIAAMVLATGFVAGMQYQKSIPVNVEVTSYSGQTPQNTLSWPMDLRTHVIELSAVTDYNRANNITGYAIYFH